ncbi:MAG: BamA/TamA family outer membrane protein [Candidatus Cyclobacteriaceae bacterium M2_1C_046]
MKNIFKYISIFIILLSGCRGTSNLTENQFLYTGAEINIESENPIKDKKQLKRDLQEHLKPEPNDQILGMRPKLAIHNIYDTVKKDKGFKHWVKYEIGNEPVLLEDVNIDRVSNGLRTALENHGFFSAEVKSAVNKDDKTAEISYNATVSEPYKFGEIHFPPGESKLARAIKDIEEELIIQKGQRYSLQKLDEQRMIFEEALNNKGFYYFNDNYLLFQIDTTVGDRQVEVFMTIKPETPQKAKRIYEIEDVIIHTSYQIGDTTETRNFDTLQVQDYTYVRKDENFRPEIIADQIRINENEIYTRKAEDITISRLLDLDVFRYVNIRYDDIGPGKLRSNIRLSPMKKKSIRAELRAVTNSLSLAGPALALSWTNRNIFKGAEHYQLKLTGAYEWQVGGGQENQAPLNSYEFGIQNSLIIPRFLTPFNIHRYSTRYVPRTEFNLGYRMLNRLNFFQLNSFDLRYGFSWRETITKTHNLFPVDVSYIKVSNKSEEFKQRLNENSFLRRSYEDQFILGASYGYVLDSRADPDNQEDTHNFFYNGHLDVSGNLVHTLQSAIQGEEDTEEEEPLRIFNQRYSQFVRVSSDLRHYLRFNMDNKLASRIMVGVGYPYGNSVIRDTTVGDIAVMPYTKQFSTGGSSSIRAFRPRSIGPGSVQVEEDQLFFDQTGDIKIEANLEYRFHIVSLLHGAVFIDAGNIWTVRDPERPKGEFDFNTFLSEFAVGTGIGIRFDVDFFVLRIDLATPIKVPYNDKFFLGLSDSEIIEANSNLSPIVLNIGIGYPF